MLKAQFPLIIDQKQMIFLLSVFAEIKFYIQILNALLVKKKIKQLQQTAILFMSYGRKALIAIAGRGIGPSTATKVLRSSIDEKELITNILKAENMYAKTRQYWD